MGKVDKSDGKYIYFLKLEYKNTFVKYKNGHVTGNNKQNGKCFLLQSWNSIIFVYNFFFFFSYQQGMQFHADLLFTI
jgi:hypothetical protein